MEVEVRNKRERGDDDATRKRKKKKKDNGEKKDPLSDAFHASSGDAIITGGKSAICFVR